MEELAIKIRIYDRQYPMRVHAKDEACVRKAGDLINKQIKTYKDKFGITDIQDLLSMIAFDYAVDNLKMQKNVTTEQKNLTNKINNMLALIDLPIDDSL